jgi:benzoyl-CoA reductase subunit BamC
VDDKLLKKRIIKNIKVDTKKCVGCRACEMACSAFHAVPKYSSVNSGRSRIMVLIDEVRDMFEPIRAGEYTEAECNARNTYIIDGKEYNECTFCPASCPSRDAFRDPDSGLPLKCDMCEDEPRQEVPLCVKWCRNEALIYEEREEEVEEQPEIELVETGLKSLMDKYGLDTVASTVARMSQKS